MNKKWEPKAALWLSFVLLISLAVWTAGCAQKLDIRNVEVCSYIDIDGAHIVQPGATFNRGDGIWLYFEARSMAVKQVEDKFECWLEFSHFEIFGPDGDMVEQLVDVGDIHEEDLPEIPKYIWLWGFFGSRIDDAPGQYRWEFTVKDKLSGAIGTGSANFTLQ